MLGLWLVEKDIISEEQLDKALDIQLHSGGRLGDILIANGATTPYELYPAFAEHMQIPFIDLLKDDWDRAAPNESQLNHYIHLRVLPIGLLHNSKVMRIATSEPLDPRIKKFCYDQYPDGVEYVITSPFDIRRAIEQLFADVITRESRYKLSELMPNISAHKRLSGLQTTLFMVLLCFFIISTITHTYQTAAFTLLGAHLLYLFTLAFKTIVFCAGLKPFKHEAPASPLVETELPSFTLLVPLYKEAAVLPKLLDSLSALNYPKQKLDIKLVLEADDEETYAAAIAYKPDYHFDMIRVPPSEPRTKPKACNYALAFAKGDIITIYDAEDIPDPDQLRKVVELFDSAPTNVHTVQAKLRYYNADQNLLTRFFDIEYAILFEHLLAGLQRLGIPIPLGGTSNHIGAERFREMGHWDPFNVTEDADLGIRFAAAGYATQMLDSTTMEECPSRIGAWMRQRSRWMKGHIQTWLVHNRRPKNLIRTTGLKGFLGFNLFLGLPYLLYITAPFILILTYLWGAEGVFKDVLPTSLSMLMAINMILFLVTHWAQAAWAYRHEKKTPQVCLAVSLFPLYWLLHIITSFKAIWQLIFRPFYWEKTEHGRTT